MQVPQFLEFKQKSNIFSLKIDKPILKIILNTQISFRLKLINWFWKYKEISNRVMHPPIILEYNKVCSLGWIFTGCYEDYKGMVNAITKEAWLVWANSLTVMTKVW